MEKKNHTLEKKKTDSISHFMKNNFVFKIFVVVWKGSKSCLL